MYLRAQKKIYEQTFFLKRIWLQLRGKCDLRGIVFHLYSFCLVSIEAVCVLY